MFRYVKAVIRSSGVLAMRMLPQSKMRMAFHYPPPGTLVGALAYPLNHLKNERREVIPSGKKFRSSAEILLPFVKWATVAVEGKPKIYGTLLKVNRIYAKATDDTVSGAVTSFPITLFYGVDMHRLITIFIIDTTSLRKNGYSLKEIVRAMWGVTRIGSRESVVSVESVETGDARMFETKNVETRFAFPVEGKKIEGKGLFQSVVNWREGLSDYSQAERQLFFYPEGYARVSGKVNAVDIGGEVIII